MIKITRLGHITLQTADLECQLAHYCEVIGLIVIAREPTRVHLASPTAGFALVLERADTPRCAKLTLEAGGGSDLPALEKALRARGLSPVASRDPAPGIGQALSITDPDGMVVEVALPAKLSERAITTTGIAVEKLGHVAFNVGDVQRSVDFYTQILGFRVSDWQGDFFAFLRCCTDHHNVNFLPGAQRKMHHAAYELTDWDHVKRACDDLARHRIRLIWGPLRHGVGHNISIYHRDPDGHIVEMFTEMDRMTNEELGYFDPRPWHEDRPQRPKVWEPCVETSNMWGIPTPQAFRD